VYKTARVYCLQPQAKQCTDFNR